MIQAKKQDITTLHTVAEYAKLMGVDRRTVYYWLADKDVKIETVKISGKTFIKAT